VLAYVTSVAEPHAELTEVPDPQPARNEALVDVRAFSLNRGEVRGLARRPPGSIAGWDVAGVVAAQAAGGSGPPEGARVVGVVNPGGAWAQRVAVPTSEMAELPDGVSFAQAATLPVAGLTALRALEIAGLVIGRRVLVTGASGGVGRFAVQLARRSGARVTAVSASPERARGLDELGAHEIVHEIEPEGERFDAVVEGVGGASLSAAIRRVAPRGTIVSFAASDPSDVSFPAGDLFRTAPGASVHGLYVFAELAHGMDGSEALGRLARLVADGELRTEIGLEASWREAPEAFRALLDRRIAGKAVLHVDA
jgi:NADPH:quinone reductase